MALLTSDAQGQPAPAAQPQPTAAPAPAGAPPGAPEPAGGIPQDKAQETHLRLGQAAAKLIFTKPTSDNLLSILKDGAESPPHAVAVAAMAVLSRMQNEVKGIDPKLVFSVAPAVIVFLLELGDAAGVIQASVPLIQESLGALANLAQNQGQAGQGAQPGPEDVGSAPSAGAPAGSTPGPAQPQPMGA